MKRTSTRERGTTCTDTGIHAVYLINCREKILSYMVMDKRIRGRKNGSVKLMINAVFHFQQYC